MVCSQSARVCLLLIVVALTPQFSLPLAAPPRHGSQHAGPRSWLTPEGTRLALGLVDATRAGGKSPEAVAAAAAALVLSDGDGGSELGPTAAAARHPPGQGEFHFDQGVPFERLYEVALAAYDASGECDGTAAHTLGLLIYNRAGGASAFDYSASNGSVLTETPPRREAPTAGDAGHLRASAVWHARAAALGNLCGLAVLGGCLCTGSGVAPPPTTGDPSAVGVRLIEAAALGGSPAGWNKLGALHERGAYESAAAPGMPLPRDEAKAFACFERAAQTATQAGAQAGAQAGGGGSCGSALGHFNVGFALFHGVGVARDEAAAVAAWRAACALAPGDGAEEAAFSLWEAFRGGGEGGRVGSAKRDKAERWLRLSAELGFAPAIEELQAKY